MVVLLLQVDDDDNDDDDDDDGDDDDYDDNLKCLFSSFKLTSSLALVIKTLAAF